jgi:hypothetical protein
VGDRLVRYYEYAKRKGGLALQMKLAMRTLMSEPKAAEAPDSPEHLKKFYDALRLLTGDDPNLPLP